VSRWQPIPNPTDDPLISQINQRGRRLGRGGGDRVVNQSITYGGGTGGSYTPDPWYNLSYAATLVVDKINGGAQRVTLSGDATLDDPVGFSNGDLLILRIKQDGTGGRTVTPADPARWELPTGFTLYGLANAVIILHYKFDASDALLIAPPTVIF
jgi:hypothetical protein